MPITCVEWKELRLQRVDQDRRWLHAKKEFLNNEKDWVNAVRTRVCDSTVGNEDCCQLITEFILANDSDDVFNTADMAILNYDFLIFTVSCSAPCWQGAALDADLYYEDEVRKWLDKVQGHVDHWLRFVEELLKNGCALKNVPLPGKNVPPVFTPLPPG